MLTGYRLFIGESDFATLEKVRNVEVTPPSSYNLELPDELERIALKALGRQGLAELVERNCDQARWMAGKLENAGFEILNDVVLNQVVVAFGNQENTERTIKNLQEAGDCWCGGTVWKGQHAMRISFSSWATTEQDMQIKSAEIPLKIPSIPVTIPPTANPVLRPSSKSRLRPSSPKIRATSPKIIPKAPNVKGIQASTMDANPRSRDTIPMLSLLLVVI